MSHDEACLKHLQATAVTARGHTLMCDDAMDEMTDGAGFSNAAMAHGGTHRAQTGASDRSASWIIIGGP